jgi:predicted dehydrogenase
MDGVVAAFRDNQPLSCDGELGRRDMVIIDGVYESIKTGKTVQLKYS